MGQMRFTGEFKVVVNGEVVGTATEVSYSESWEAHPAPDVRWWLPEPEARRVPNRHDRRRAAVLARRGWA